MPLAAIFLTIIFVGEAIKEVTGQNEPFRADISILYETDVLLKSNYEPFSLDLIGY